MTTGFLKLCLMGLKIYVDSKYRAKLAQKVREDRQNKDVLRFLYSNKNTN